VLLVSVHANSFVWEAYCDCAGSMIRNMAPVKIQLCGHYYVHRFNDRVNTTNHLMSDELSNRFPMASQGFWEESAKQSALAGGDGVHLTDTGNHKL